MHRAAAGIAVTEASKHVSNSLEEQAGSVRCGDAGPAKGAARAMVALRRTCAHLRGRAWGELRLIVRWQPGGCHFPWCA